MNTFFKGRSTNLLLPALLVLAGCMFNPALYKKGAFSIDDWETWTSWNDAFGEHSVSSGELSYRLGAGQDDTYDMPFNGRSPGLILSRELTGRNWSAEAHVRFKVPAGRLKRFSFGVWAGGEYVRPSLGSPAAVLKLLVQRRNGPKPDDDAFLITAPPLKESAVKIPKEAKALRFDRSGNSFAVSYSLDGKEFRQALRVESEDAAAAPSQKFFVSGLAEGNPQGAYAEFTSLTINGRETLQ